jgi:hypothetical protein
MSKSRNQGPSYDFSTVRKPKAMKQVPGNPQGKVAQESQKMPAAFSGKTSDLRTHMVMVPGNPNKPASGKG